MPDVRQSSILAHIAQNKDFYKENKDLPVLLELLERLDDFSLEIARVMLGQVESEDEEVIRAVEDFEKWVESLRKSTRPSSSDCEFCDNSIKTFRSMD